MHASVIVVNWRQPELTLRCLAALAAQETTRSVEVVLVENEAVPGAADVFRQAYPDVRVVEDPRNSGFAGGVTSGIAASTGEVIVLVNNDAVPDSDFIDQGLDVLERAGADVAAVSATVVLEGLFVPASSADDHTLRGLDGALWRRASDSEGGKTLLNGTGISMNAQANGHDREWLSPVDSPRETGEPFGFSGGAAFLRRAALDEVGGFDESLFMYYEDLDVSWRLRLAGYRIEHAPGARVVHRHAASSSSGGELVRRQSMRNRLAVTVRNGSPGLILRVACRTGLRFGRDLVRPDQAFLSRDAWRGVFRQVPQILRHARRARRRAAVPAWRRRDVERLIG